MANGTEKTFLVSLKLQEGCSCRELEEVDKQLYEHVKGQNKSYAYDTIKLHDKCYMIIKIWADKDHEELLKKVLKDGEYLNIS